MKRAFSLAAALALSGCVSGPAPEPGPLAVVPVIDPRGGICVSRATTPAIIETVTDQVLVQPPEIGSDGTVRSPAVFRTVTQQRILRERREVEFETPCPTIQTPEFIASLQRALQARGYLRGPINGVYDERTGRAVQRFQSDRGDVDSPVLTLETGRALGLIALPREAQE